MNEREQWDLKFLGKLKEESHFLVTKDRSTIRYGVDIISNPPINLPEDALKFLTSFRMP